MEQKMNVGGQAVIEGVMMRSPKALVISVRNPDGKIIIKDEKWINIGKGKLRKLPFIRGVFSMLEAMTNGIRALTFSANIAMPEEDGDMSKGAMFITVLISLFFAFAIFKVAPHVLTRTIGWLFGKQLTVEDFAFHFIDACIKTLIFLGYLLGISLMKDVKRLFQYHGAEHKAVNAYEAGVDLTIDNVKKFSTIHPRCGTSFIFLVFFVSMFVFMAFFPLIPPLSKNTYINMLIMISLKLPLLFPIAGISFELLKLSGKKKENKLLKIFIWPGLLLQRLTTKEPDDDMLETSISSIKRVLRIEEELKNGNYKFSEEPLKFDSYLDVN